MSQRRNRIEEKLDAGLTLAHLEVLDESSNHSVPDGAESHFKVVAVASEFEGQRRLDRHRLVNGLLQSEFDGGMHALAVHTYTADEWAARFGNAPMSPPCAKG